MLTTSPREYVEVDSFQYFKRTEGLVYVADVYHMVDALLMSAAGLNLAMKLIFIT